MEVRQAKSCLIAVMSLFLVADTAIIATRVYVRAFMIRAFGWDDAALCLSYASPLFESPAFHFSAKGSASDDLVQVGFVIGCIMGFTAIHFGYAYDGPPDSWPNYDQKKAQTVSQHLHLQLSSNPNTHTDAPGSSSTPTSSRCTSHPASPSSAWPWSCGAWPSTDVFGSSSRSRWRSSSPGPSPPRSSRPGCA